MKKRIVSILVVLVLASSMVCSQAFVVDTKAVPSADGISKMIDGIKESAKEFKKTHIINEDGSRTELDKYKKPKNTKKKNSNLPSYYVAPYTSIKDQNRFGSCWMFGEVGSVESNLLNKAGYSGGLQDTDPIDLSEAQGVYTQYHKQTKAGTITGEVVNESCNDSEKYDDNYYGYDEGGWELDASMTFTSDKGKVFESDNPFISVNDSTMPEDSRAMAEVAAANYRTSHFNMKSAEMLPEIFPVVVENGRKVRHYIPENRDIWKQKIINNGAISSNYYQAFENKYNHTWGYDDDFQYGPNFWMHDANVRGRYGTNHVITVVGFNDNYSKYHYLVKYTSQSYDELVGEIVYIKLNENNEPDMTFNADGSIDSIQTSETAEEGYQAYIVPKEDGAWIIKNSYGTEYQGYKIYDDGIVYMTYCEETIGGAVSSVVEESLDQINSGEKVYDTTLSHSSLQGEIVDGLEPDVKAAEVYSIGNDKDIELGQIGYWTSDEETVSRFKIYGDLTDKSEPEYGTLLYDSGDITDVSEGYHTIDLEETITLAHSTKASIVTTQACGDETGLMLEFDYSSVSNASYLPKCVRNDTKYYLDDEWIDAKDLDQELREDGYTVGNSTVKLFGNAKSVEPETTTTNKYTITIDGNKNYVDIGQDFTFPTTSANGYANSDYSTLYASGQTITPEGDITVTSIPEFDFEMIEGASLDLKGRDGIRFGAVADCFDEDFFNSSNVKCGTLITTEDIYIDSLEEKLDLDTAEKAGSDKVFNIENSGWDHNIVGNYAAGVIGIKQFNWKRALLARGYMIVNYSDGSNKVLYTGVSPSRSIVQVAEFLRDSGYPDMTPEQIAVVQKYLSED